VETVAEGLSYPWSLAFLPNGSMLLTERDGRLRVIENGRLLDRAVSGVPPVYVRSQAGLFDIVLDPGFSENQLVYLSFAHGTDRANATRVVRARLTGMSLQNVEVIFTATPVKATPNHFGGRMLFLPDGTLLITTGDGFNYREAAQKLDNHLGKVVRINPDGSVPDTNPFSSSDHALPEIWSYGHRNSQAIVMNTGTGTVYLHEHGARGGDELNVILPGRNYGWPAITLGIDYTFAQITPYTELPGMEQPILHWTPSIAPAGMAYYDGDMFPEWRRNLFVAALAEKSVRRIVLNGDRVVDQQLMFTDLEARFRDVRVGHDGALYLLTDSAEGKVLRIVAD
jgi:glucose/arabinose dehydrogenase